jgi:hypothetical protein
MTIGRFVEDSSSDRSSAEQKVGRLDPFSPQAISDFSRGGTVPSWAGKEFGPLNGPDDRAAPHIGGLNVSATTRNPQNCQ